MQIIKFFDATNTLKCRADSFDDLYLLQRIIANGDGIAAKSFRRFKANETDTGSQKEVFVKISVEKSELDKTSGKLRLTGKILEGHPEEFVKISSYHTINVGIGDVIEIQKTEWRHYIIRRLKEAVEEAKRPRFGVIAMDDELATIAYIRGYGIEIVAEIYSHLSKRMKDKEYAEQRKKYFDEVIAAATRLEVDNIVVAGPGFTKDDLKAYMESERISLNKKISYVHASSADRAGIREAMQSEDVARLLESEHLKKEFALLNKFLESLRVGAAFYGEEQVGGALESFKAGVVLVNDDMINNAKTQELLERADAQKVKIEIFNSDDEAGAQLRNFKGIGAISKSVLQQ
ncbi:MAG: mRNA surveillance protein pelota [Candidatus Micrarchaeia archaeon]